MPTPWVMRPPTCSTNCSTSTLTAPKLPCTSEMAPFISKFELLRNDVFNSTSCVLWPSCITLLSMPPTFTTSSSYDSCSLFMFLPINSGSCPAMPGGGWVDGIDSKRAIFTDVSSWVCSSRAAMADSSARRTESFSASPFSRYSSALRTSPVRLSVAVAWAVALASRAFTLRTSALTNSALYRVQSAIFCVYCSSRCCIPDRLLTPAMRSSCDIMRTPDNATAIDPLSIGRLAFGVVPFGRSLGSPAVGDGNGLGLIACAIPSNIPDGMFGLFPADPAMAPTTIKIPLRLCV